MGLSRSPGNNDGRGFPLQQWSTNVYRACRDETIWIVLWRMHQQPGPDRVGVGSEISDVYLYSGKTFTDIGSLLLFANPNRYANSTYASGINDDGLVMGTSGMDWGNYEGFIYNGGNMDHSVGICLQTPIIA